MPTVCTPKLFEFEAVEHRAAVAGSDGRDNSTRRGWMSTSEKKCINDDGKKAPELGGFFKYTPTHRRAGTKFLHFPIGQILLRA